MGVGLGGLLVLQDCVPDGLDDPRDGGVAELLHGSHVCGKSISHARKLRLGIPRSTGGWSHPSQGSGQRRTHRSRETLLLVEKLRTSCEVLRRWMWSCAQGVGMLWVGDCPNPVP